MALMRTKKKTHQVPYMTHWGRVLEMPPVSEVNFVTLGLLKWFLAFFFFGQEWFLAFIHVFFSFHVVRIMLQLQVNSMDKV